MLRLVKNVLRPYPYTLHQIRHNYIFIHVPKAAGTTMLASLGSKGQRIHLNWRVYQQANPSLFEKAFKFSVVRNPVSRLESAYRYLCLGGSGFKPDAVLGEFIKKNFTSFDDFVFNYLTPCQMATHNLFRPQVFFLCDAMGNVKVDRVIKQEELIQHYQSLRSTLTFMEPELHAHNVTKSEPHPVSLETAARIQELYNMDFLTFSYQSLR